MVLCCDPFLLYFINTYFLVYFVLQVPCSFGEQHTTIRQKAQFVACKTVIYSQAQGKALDSEAGVRALLRTLLSDALTILLHC